MKVYLDNVENKGYSGSGVYTGTMDMKYIGMDTIPVFEEGITTPLDLSGHTELTDYDGLQIVSRETNGSRPQFTSFDELMIGPNFGNQTNRDLRTDPLPSTMVNIGDDTIPNLYNLTTNFIATTFSKNDLQCMFDNPDLDITVQLILQTMSNTGIIVANIGYITLSSNTDGEGTFWLDGTSVMYTGIYDRHGSFEISKMVGVIPFRLDNDGQASSPFYRYSSTPYRPDDDSVMDVIRKKIGNKIAFGQDVSKFKKVLTKKGSISEIEIPENTKFPSWQGGWYKFGFDGEDETDFFPYAVKSAVENFVCNVNKNYDIKRGLSYCASTFGIQIL